MKVLIVDNKSKNRLIIETTLRAHAEIVFQSNAHDALANIIEEQKTGGHFDIITIDLDALKTNGINLLKMIRRHEELVNSEIHSLLLITTTSCKREKIIECAKAGCNGFIIKPFSPETILSKLAENDIVFNQVKSKKPVDLDGLLEEIYYKKENNALTLPSHPQIAMKFRELRAKEASYKQIEEVLKNDISISAKLIQVANSAIFGGISKYKTLTEAMNRLGLAETDKYVSAIANKRLYENLPKNLSEFTHQLWQHSLACAYATELISKEMKEPISVDPFTLGLMHDVGKLLLLQMFYEIAKEKRVTNLLESEELFDIIDKLHEEFGAEILHKWKFSDEFCETILYHENLEEAPEITPDLKLIKMADMLVKSMGYTTFKEEKVEMDHDLTYRTIKVRHSKMEEIAYKVEKKLKTTNAML